MKLVILFVFVCAIVMANIETAPTNVLKEFMATESTDLPLNSTTVDNDGNKTDTVGNGDSALSAQKSSTVSFIVFSCSIWSSLILIHNPQQH